MTAPVVDVVVVAYGSESTIDRCVRSVVGDPVVASVVVVDNASPDGSAAVARSVGARVVDAGANRGFGSGCNIGTLVGSAPFVLFLNPDAEVAPGTVAGLAAHLSSSERTGAVGSEVLDGEGRPQPSRRRSPSVLRAALEPGLAARLDERHYRRRSASHVDWVSGACLMVRRSAFEAVGGFDERFFLYSEETDLARRLRAAGWWVDWVAGFPTVHGAGQSTARLAGRGKVAWVDGWMRYVTDHGSRPARSWRAALVVGLAGRAVAWRLRGRPEQARPWMVAAMAAVQWREAPKETGGVTVP